ncbi:hypothetical protein OH77DRAFT_1436525 [Trametes cingulata]|nr:hypothetical protein OH77DRAFT_1436525 [Trametes cingulata]
MADISAFPYSVLLKICKSLRGEESWEGPKALSSLARTCRFLSEPALDMLGIFPEDLLHFRPESRNTAGKITSAACVDLTRFWFYSCRVRKLNVPTHPTRLHILAERYFLHRARLLKSIWQSLSRYGPEPLLPNLHSLQHCEPLPYKKGIRDTLDPRT